MKVFDAGRVLSWILIVLVAAALPAAGHALWLRHQAEHGNRSVEVAVDLQAFESMARHEGSDLEALYAALREAGVTTLAVSEMTVERLLVQGRVTVVSGSELLSWRARHNQLRSILAARLDAGEVRPEFSYLLVPERVAADQIESELCLRLPRPCTLEREQAGSLTLLTVPVSTEKLMTKGLGIWPEDLDLANRFGFLVSPRFQDVRVFSAAEIENQFDRVAAEASVRTVVFGGMAVLGAEGGNLDATARAMRAHGLVLGAIESVDLRAHLSQAGLGPLTEALDYQVARVYSIAPEYQARLDPQEVVDIWVRSPKERNIRFLYLRPFFGDRGDETITATLASIVSTAEGLQSTGYHLGPAGVFSYYRLSGWHRLALAALAVAGGLGMLRYLRIGRPGLLLAGGAVML
ncbi:MAG: DUF5693 family protein, partial [Thermaerobacterales bacterium]